MFYIIKLGSDDLSDFYVKNGCYCNCVFKNEISNREV